MIETRASYKEVQVNIKGCCARTRTRAHITLHTCIYTYKCIKGLTHTRGFESFRLCVCVLLCRVAPGAAQEIVLLYKNGFLWDKTHFVLSDGKMNSYQNERKKKESKGKTQYLIMLCNVSFCITCLLYVSRCDQGSQILVKLGIRISNMKMETYSNVFINFHI